MLALGCGEAMSAHTFTVFFYGTVGALVVINILLVGRRGYALWAWFLITLWWGAIGYCYAVKRQPFKWMDSASVLAAVLYTGIQVKELLGQLRARCQRLGASELSKPRAPVVELQDSLGAATHK
jgi:hypothetical protein